MFTIQPTSLLSALFIQLGNAICGDAEHRQCKACRAWFEMVPQDKGRKEFCGDACKARDYRERKKRARAAWGAGRGDQQIANETETDLSTVQKWISAFRRQPDGE